MTFADPGERFVHHVAGGGGGDGRASEHALWWPPSKIAGRRLAPYLAEHGAAAGGETAPTAGVAVQVDLEPALQTSAP